MYAMEVIKQIGRGVATKICFVLGNGWLDRNVQGVCGAALSKKIERTKDVKMACSRSDNMSATSPLSVPSPNTSAQDYWVLIQ